MKQAIEGAWKPVCKSLKMPPGGTRSMRSSKVLFPDKKWYWKLIDIIVRFKRGKTGWKGKV